MKYICSFGKLHHISEQCTCSTKYGMSVAMFETRLEKLFPKIQPKKLTYSQFNTIVNPFLDTYHDKNVQ